MRIFISAVTSEFGKARDALRSDLSARGHDVTVQSDFTQRPDSATLLGALAGARPRSTPRSRSANS
jgi:hypothetical protein